MKASRSSYGTWGTVGGQAGAPTGLSRLMAFAGMDGAHGGWGLDDGFDLREWKLGRPSLPPMLFLALSMWAGTAASIELLFGASARSCLVGCAGAAAFVLTASALLCRRRVLAGCLLLGLGLGALLGCANAWQMLAAQQQLLDDGGTRMARITRDARPGERGDTAIADVGGALVRLALPSESGLLVGDMLPVSGSWRLPGGKSERASWRSGIVATARVTDLAGACPADDPLHVFRRAAVSAIGEEAAAMGQTVGRDLSESAAFLGAVVLGHAGELYATALYQAVKADGLAHLVAVSGAHLVMVCGMASAALGRAPIARGVSAAVQVCLIAGYLVLTGAPVSAVRAAVMAVLGMLSFVSGRRPYSLGGLSCCIVAMLALDPAAAFSASFILSAAATLGIVLFSGLVGGILGGAGGGCGLPPGTVRDTVALTLASSTVATPLSACMFGQVSLIAPVANLVAAPLFPLACVGGLAVVVLAVAAGPPGRFALGLLLLALQAGCGVLELLARIPFASCPASLGMPAVALLAAGVPGILWVAWPAPSRRLAAACVASCAVAIAAAACIPVMRGDCITMLDVGQGDAILVQSAGRSLLIDTGTEDAALLEGLASCGAYSLDAVLVTHPDDDHCGSLGALRGVVPVGSVLVARDLLVQDEPHCAGLRRQASALVGPQGIRGLSVGDALHVGNLEFTVVGPDAFEDGGGNADSLVLRMSWDADGDGAPDIRALFTGDAEEPQVARYAAQGRVGDVDILKVGHHGSRASVDAALLDTLRPEVALVSVGEFNTYGHPTPEAMACLEDAGSAVFRTDEQGAITCYLRSDGVHVRTQR